MHPPLTDAPARLSALLLAAVVALGGCSGETESGADTSQPQQEPSEAAPKPKTHPFTGEKVARLPKRRAVAVKIENTESSEPQAGVGAADLVVRQLVEGGLTRLVGFYYSDLPRRVGPVRSMRATDIGIAQPTSAVLTGSGGAPVTMERIRKARVPFVRESSAPSAYTRVDSRPAPYNLFMNLRRLPKGTLKGPRPDAYLPWGPASRLGKGSRARRATVTFSGVTTTDWRWAGGHWQRSDSHTARGDDFRPQNLLTLEVRQVDAGYRDPAGNPVPESVFAGRGAATLLHRDRAYRGAWVKKSLKSPLRLVTSRGRRMPVPPGPTWIELVPRSTGGIRLGR
jgi:hypothetical protein